MREDDFDTFDDNDLISFCGVDHQLFEQIFTSYCKGKCASIRRRWCLVQLLHWLKVYPTGQVLALVFESDRRAIEQKVIRMLAALSESMKGVIPSMWALRHTVPDAIAPLKLTSLRAIGSVDTFPIAICRPEDSGWNEATFNAGKYKKCCLKVQVTVGWTGIPLHVSGPHIGVRSDIMLWRVYGPHLPANEVVLGDKAYVAVKRPVAVLAPFKGKRLNEAQQDFNTLHSWYRAGVEHFFANAKRFAIMGGRLRLHLRNSHDVVRQCIDVVISILALRILHRPLRVHKPMIAPDDDNSDDDDNAIVVGGGNSHVVPDVNDNEPPPPLVPAAIEVLLANGGDEKRAAPSVSCEDVQSLDNFRPMFAIGDWKIHARRVHVGPGPLDFTWVGIGKEPSNRFINTHNTLASFKPRDKVYVWWWNYWWAATIQSLQTRLKTLTVRFDGGLHKGAASGYLPRLVLHSREVE